VLVAVTDARLDFGPWEQIFMASLMAAPQARLVIIGEWSALLAELLNIALPDN
jgi:thiamine phosphate synthase YjbQ (UPF0047 family)